MYILKDFDINEIPKSDYKLCYVESNGNKEDEENYGFLLYFTSARMEDQWGDDWDDAQYEYNAGRPYDIHYIDDKKVEHTILALQMWVSAENWLKMPSDFSWNSFSVDEINSGAVAWLYKPSEGKCCNGIAVHAGMTPEEVAWKIGHLFIKPNKQHN